MTAECPFLGVSKRVVNTQGNSGITYGGGGNSPARAGESQLWDDEDNDSGWDQL